MVTHADPLDGRLFGWTESFGRHVGVSEASTLALPPGVWPALLQVRSHRTGTVRAFLRTGLLGVGESQYHVYVDGQGVELHVWNS
jgi:hypothetical protein